MPTADQTSTSIAPNAGDTHERLTKANLQFAISNYKTSSYLRYLNPLSSALPPRVQELANVIDDLKAGELDEQELDSISFALAKYVFTETSGTKDVYDGIQSLVDAEFARLNKVRNEAVINTPFKKIYSYIFPDEVIESGLNAMEENIGFKFPISKSFLSIGAAYYLIDYLTNHWQHTDMLSCALMMQWMSLIRERTSNDSTLRDSGYKIQTAKLVAYTLFVIQPILANLDSDNPIATFSVMLGSAVLGMFVQSKAMSLAHSPSGNEQLLSQRLATRPHTNEFLELVGSCFTFLCAAATPLFLFDYYKSCYPSPFKPVIDPEQSITLSAHESNTLNRLNKDSQFSLEHKQLCQKTLGLNPNKIYTLKEIRKASRMRSLFWAPDKCHNNPLCQDDKHFSDMGNAVNYLSAHLK
jgi:hypothetical protein